MKKITTIALILGLCFSFSCSKKSKPQESPRTTTNPVEQYGGVMSKTLKTAKGMDAVLPLKQIIDSFYVEQGRYPATLQELIEKNYIKEIPAPPKGYKYSYDGSTGKIGLEPEN